MDMNGGKKWFAEHTAIMPELWLWHNIYRLNFRGKKIALAITYGSPMTSELVHIFSVLGVKIILQIGCFGGLVRSMRVGDILLPHEAIRADGASDWYLPKNTVPRASKDVHDWLHIELHSKHVVHRIGPIFTTTAMLAETPEIIQNWSDNGYFGVDLETATSFSVAQHFGTKKAAILYLGDNIIQGRHFLDVSREEEQLKAQGQKVVFSLALETVRKFAN
jgi:uridine phosphorylase